MTKTTTPTKTRMLCTVELTVESSITTEDYFKSAGVVWMGENFQTQFLGLEIGLAVATTRLAVHELVVGLLDEEIFTELEGRDKAEISVQEFKAFLVACPKGKEFFIFYLRGRDRNLWAVCAHWGTDRGGWRVDAHSVEDPLGWGAGDQVVSRN